MKEKIIFPHDFPGSPVVKTLHFHCRGMSSIPGQGTKILHVTGPTTHARARTHTHTRTLHFQPQSVLVGSTILLRFSWAVCHLR